MSKQIAPHFTDNWRADIRRLGNVWVADFRGPNLTSDDPDVAFVALETQIRETLAAAQEVEASYAVIWHGKGRRRKGQITMGAFVNALMRDAGMWQHIRRSRCHRYEDALLVAIRPLLNPHDWDKLEAKAYRAEQLRMTRKSTR